MDISESLQLIQLYILGCTVTIEKGIVLLHHHIADQQVEVSCRILFDPSENISLDDLNEPGAVNWWCSTISCCFLCMALMQQTKDGNNQDKNSFFVHHHCLGKESGRGAINGAVLSFLPNTET